MLRDQPFMRDDTFLGVCQALGDGLRIPPNLLRVAVAPLIIWNPVGTLSVYLVVGLVIAIAHWIVPGKSAAPAATAQAAPATFEPAAESAEVEFAKAA